MKVVELVILNTTIFKHYLFPELLFPDNAAAMHSARVERVVSVGQRRPWNSLTRMHATLIDACRCR